MGKLKKAILFSALMLFWCAGLGTPVLSAEAADPGEQVVLSIPVSIVPAQGQSNLTYTAEVAVKATEKAIFPEGEVVPVPDQSVLTVSSSKTEAEFTLKLPRPGIFEYTLTPSVKSGSVKLVSDKAKIVRIWRNGDGTTGIKAYEEGDPYEGVDLKWEVETTAAALAVQTLPRPTLPESAASAHTGSDTQASLWASLLLMAAFGFCFLFFVRRDQKRED